MAVSSQQKEAWEQLRAMAMSGSAEIVARQHCPSCSAALRITFTEGDRTAISIHCVSCFAAAHIDGELPAPPWTVTLGQSILTSI